MGPLISVIIPAFNEAETINRTIDALFRLNQGADLEVVVADGHPASSTLSAIRDPRVKKVAAPKGRGVQMNAGARRAAGGIFLFLHADTTPPATAAVDILHTLNMPGVVAGAFDLSIQNAGPGLRLIAGMANARSRLTKIPYGDQAIFMKRAVFFALGGFSAIPLMEDVDLMGRIKKKGWKIRILKSRVSTSSRRWDAEGPVRCTLRNWMLIFLYYLGVRPETLARFYK